MPVTVRHIQNIMEGIAPRRYAEKWDNVGLQIGQTDWPADRIGVALDASPDIVKAAASRQLNLLVTHHPLIFRPVSSIDFGSPFGQIVTTAVENKMSILTAHTNYDIAEGGLNDILCERLDLKRSAPLCGAEGSEAINLVLDPDGTGRQILLEKNNNVGERHFQARLTVLPGSAGIGRIGELEPPMALKAFAALVKARLELEMVRMTGDPDLMISRVAVCTGSGSSLMKDFFQSDAQVFVSGDLRYHDARDVQAAGRALIDVGHFGSEVIMVDALAQQLAEHCDRAGLKADITPLKIETDPFQPL
jgi:dinuclear metal center YbgI/SA1388 family protein